MRRVSTTVVYSSMQCLYEFVCETSGMWRRTAYLALGSQNNKRLSIIGLSAGRSLRARSGRFKSFSHDHITSVAARKKGVVFTQGSCNQSLFL
jgi:hypothetical protein